MFFAFSDQIVTKSDVQGKSEFHEKFLIFKKYVFMKIIENFFRIESKH